MRIGCLKCRDPARSPPLEVGLSPPSAGAATLVRTHASHRLHPAHHPRRPRRPAGRRAQPGRARPGAPPAPASEVRRLTRTAAIRERPAAFGAGWSCSTSRRSRRSRAAPRARPPPERSSGRALLGREPARDGLRWVAVELGARGELQDLLRVVVHLVEPVGEVEHTACAMTTAGSSSTPQARRSSSESRMPRTGWSASSRRATSSATAASSLSGSTMAAARCTRSESVIRLRSVCMPRSYPPGGGASPAAVRPRCRRPAPRRRSPAPTPPRTGSG
jgi:hypothetical protein